MAGLTKDQRTLKQIDKAGERSANAIRGLGHELDVEDAALRELIGQTTQRTVQKYGNNGNEHLKVYAQGALASALTQNIEGGKNIVQPEEQQAFFKKFMEMNRFKESNDTITRDQGFIQTVTNYQAIYKHIPECGKGVNVMGDNIISPDTFNRRGFDIVYNGGTDTKKKQVKDNCAKIMKKYEIDKKVASITRDTLVNGVSYTAVLSLERELNALLTDEAMNGFLNESTLSKYDTTFTSNDVNENNLPFTEAQRNVLCEYFNIKSTENLDLELNGDRRKSQDKPRKYSLKVINENIDNLLRSEINKKFKPNSKLDLMKENIELACDKHKTLIEQGYFYEDGKYTILNETVNDVPDTHAKKGKKGTGKKKRYDNKPLFLTGSVIRELNPVNVVDLEIDGIDYGKYYIEYEENGAPQSASEHPTLGGSSMLGNSVNDVNGMTGGMGGNMANNRNQAKTGAAKQYGVSDDKIKFITDIFINSISIKIDKDYVRRNKDFKEFIYTMLKQEKATRKEARITYFAPDEVVTIKTPPMFEPISYFAKLYLAMLTNIIMLNVTRGHDKRIFYVNSGLDVDFTSSVESLIRNIKSKDIRIGDNDVSSILNLNFGILDDLFVPTVGGNRPFDLDIVQGQEVDIQSNSFLDWLKRSCLNGMDVPPIYLDMAAEMDFSRTVASSNGVFASNIISRQADFQPGFTKLIQKLYLNEYKYNDDGESEENENTVIDDIEAILHAPSALVNQAMSEQLSTISQVGEEVSMAVVPPKQDGSTEDLRQIVKAKYIRESCPNIDWEFYIAFLDEAKQILAKEKVEAKIEPKVTTEEEEQGGYY